LRNKDLQVKYFGVKDLRDFLLDHTLEESKRGAPFIAHFAMNGFPRPPKRVEKLRYVHRDPVKSGLVERPKDWFV